MPTPVFHGTINKGEFKLNNPKQFKIYLTSLQYKTQPAKVEIIVRRYRKKRSTNQNNYYWLCINLIAQETGNEPDELHNYFKSQFLIDRSGKIPVVKSTTRLNTNEFSEYFEKIKVLVADFNIILPNPDDVYF